MLRFINGFSKLMGIFLHIDFGGLDRRIQKVHTTAQTGRNLLTSLTSAASALVVKMDLQDIPHTDLGSVVHNVLIVEKACLHFPQITINK